MKEENRLYGISTGNYTIEEIRNMSEFETEILREESKKRMGAIIIVFATFLIFSAFIGLLIGYNIGMVIQEKYSKELFFIENNNLENRTCLNPNKELSYCRKLDEKECQFLFNGRLIAKEMPEDSSMIITKGYETKL